MIYRFAVFILLITGLIIGVYLIGQRTGFFSKADISPVPQKIKISNISDNSFTVSWLTAKEAPGFVSFGEDDSLGNITGDDRDANGPKSRITHHVSLKNLQPSTAYYYQINSAGQILTQTTAPITLDTPPLPEPVFGKVLTQQNTPISESIIYSKAGDSTLLSSYTRADGNFLITLNNARSADLKNYAKVTDADRVSLEVKTVEGSAQKEIPAGERKSAIALILENNPKVDKLEGDLNDDRVVNAVDYAITIKRLIFN